jgi:tetratricopeptide (TPR) repeat protein
MAPRKQAEDERKFPAALEAEEAARAFCESLRWQMDNGTRPGSTRATPRRWSATDLGEACGVSDRQVRNWLNGANLPVDMATLERVLFGDDPEHASARREFHTAWATARQRTSVKQPDRPVPPPTEEQPHPHQSILPPARCFGRDDEADALIAALATPTQAALLVLGSGGIGKTTLTRRVATDSALVTRFGTRRWFVELDTATDAATLRAAIIQALGLPPATTDLAAALNVLSRQPALLVLDNLETPWEADQRAVQDVLQALAITPGVSLLASLRGRSAPSAPRWTRRTELEPLPEPEARRLFLDLAPAAEDEPEHLNHFLKALAGVPLAVELVALQAACGIALRELWAMWQRRGIELAAHPDLGPDRLTSLARSLDLSWRSPRLKDPGRRLFRMLGQLPAGIADPDREALLGDDAMPAAQQLRAIGLAGPRDGRLDLLPPVRDYARTTHPPPPEDQAAWCRHYLSLARDIGGRIWRTGGAEAVIRLTPEVPNIDAALLAAEAASLRADAIAALRGVALLLGATGAGSLLPLEELAAACAADADPAGEAACHFWRGWVAFYRSDSATSKISYQRAIPLFQKVGDIQGEASCIQGLGDIALRRSQHDAARDAYQRAIPLFQKVGDILSEANCIKSLGDIALARSQHDDARDAYQRAIPLFQTVGDILGEANCIRSLGNIALERSQHDAARDAYQRAIPLYQTVGSILGEANCIQRLGDIALRRAQHDTARDAFQRAIPLYQTVGSILGEANCIKSLGDIALRRSQHDDARDAYQRAIPLYQTVGHILGEANCIQSLGDIDQREARPGAARTRFEQALAMYQRIPEPYSIGWAHVRLADLSEDPERQGHLAAARAAWESIGRPDLVAKYLDS